MDMVYSHCAGLDVHKETVVACVRVAAGGEVTKEVRTFKTTTSDLVALADWLLDCRCTHVAMEATGVYWRPVWQVLAAETLTLILANAAHIKNVPGRKTDVADAAWISDLLAHGLIRGSFVPDAPTQELRSLLRTRNQFIRERCRHIQRLQKTLEESNIKLESAVSDIMGKSGRTIVEAIIAGETNPETLARLAHRRLKTPRDLLCEALRGRVTHHHRFLLGLHLETIDRIDDAIGKINEEVEKRLEPFRAACRLLLTVPGISEISAWSIIAEIGTDMSRFATAGHLISWGGLCPRNDESAGKRRSTRLRKGSNWLRVVLVQCAWAASRKKDSYLRAQFHRLKARGGAKKAICAVAGSILTAIYHMLKNGTAYLDPGADHFDKCRPERQARKLVERLTNLGFEVTLKQVPNPAVSSIS